MGERRGAYRVLVGENQGRETTWQTPVYSGVIIKWIFKKRDGGHGLDSSGS
jgi:hypothetical protein